MKKISLTLKATLLVSAMVCATNAVSEEKRYWNISFDITDGTPPEHVSLNFYTSDTLQSNATNTFYGYLIDYTTLTGYQGENAVLGLPARAFFNVNDNLFNPESNLPLDLGGLAYKEIKTGVLYQVFYNGRFRACSQTCYAPLTASPFNVSNFTFIEIK